MNGVDEFQVFVQQHRNQLEAGGVPQLYWNTLFHKVRNSFQEHHGKPNERPVMPWYFKFYTKDQHPYSKYLLKGPKPKGC